MKAVRPVLILTLAAGLTACASTGDVTRAAPGETGLLSAAPAPAATMAISRDYQVRNVEVIVPPSLTTNEQNSFKPRVDIVWREDPPGDRHAQVDTLVTDAIVAAVAVLEGARAVDLNLELTHFHALTQRTRYSAPFGATHDVGLILTVLDAETGEVLEPARPVGFEIEAHTGYEALADEAKGITQKSRISEALAEMILAELAAPQG